MPLSIRAASEADLPLLAEMNKRLIADEGSRNPMSIPELEHRIRGWLQGGWNADLFFETRPGLERQAGADAIVVGYAIYQHRTDEYDPSHRVVYLRQFLVDRPYRNRSLGRLALKMLFDSRFPARSTVVVDVLAANPRGLGFWERLGFRPYMTTLKTKLGD